MAVDSSPVGVQNLKGAIEWGQQTVKSLELVNGGAVLAILTFYGNVVKDGSHVPIDLFWLTAALAVYAAGLVFALIAACCAYLGQVVIATSETDKPNPTSQEQQAFRTASTRTSKNFLKAAVVMALISLGLFASGTASAIRAILSSPHTSCVFQPISSLQKSTNVDQTRILQTIPSTQHR